ncbi:hypothetical protein E4U32_004471 [Claviceps aff. humidiphila group G2b]|nr:hypothetical protein E4U32_004471 [Claviceps aff. humidiphila group G2b]
MARNVLSLRPGLRRMMDHQEQRKPSYAFKWTNYDVTIQELSERRVSAQVTASELKNGPPSRIMLKSWHLHQPVPRLYALGHENCPSWQHWIEQDHVDDSSEANQAIDNGSEANQAIDNGGEANQAIDNGGEANQAIDNGGEANQAIDNGSEAIGHDNYAINHDEVTELLAL